MKKNLRLPKLIFQSGCSRILHRCSSYCPRFEQHDNLFLFSLVELGREGGGGAQMDIPLLQDKWLQVTTKTPDINSFTALWVYSFYSPTFPGASMKLKYQNIRWVGLLSGLFSCRDAYIWLVCGPGRINEQISSQRHTCLKEIGLHFQISVPTRHSIVSTIGRTYVSK